MGGMGQWGSGGRRGYGRAGELATFPDPRGPSERLARHAAERYLMGHDALTTRSGGLTTRTAWNNDALGVE